MEECEKRELKKTDVAKGHVHGEFIVQDFQFLPSMHFILTF